MFFLVFFLINFSYSNLSPFCFSYLSWISDFRENPTEVLRSPQIYNGQNITSKLSDRITMKRQMKSSQMMVCFGPDSKGDSTIPFQWLMFIERKTPEEEVTRMTRACKLYGSTFCEVGSGDERSGHVRIFKVRGIKYYDCFEVNFDIGFFRGIGLFFRSLFNPSTVVRPKNECSEFRKTCKTNENEL